MFIYQDEAKYFKHEIFWATDAENTAHCPPTDGKTLVDCYTFLVGALEAVNDPAAAPRLTSTSATYNAEDY